MFGSPVPLPQEASAAVNAPLAMLDPIADKLLVGAALMMLVGLGRLSYWSLYPAIVIMSGATTLRRVPARTS